MYISTSLYYVLCISYLYKHNNGYSSYKINCKLDMDKFIRGTYYTKIQGEILYFKYFIYHKNRRKTTNAIKFTSYTQLLVKEHHIFL